MRAVSPNQLILFPVLSNAKRKRGRDDRLGRHCNHQADGRGVLDERLDAFRTDDDDCRASQHRQLTKSRSSFDQCVHGE